MPPLRETLLTFCASEIMNSLKNHKFILIVITLIAIILVATGIYIVTKPQPKIGGGIPIDLTPTIQWIQPTTDAEWAEDVKQESLNLKLDSELTQMLGDLQNSLTLAQKDLDKYTNCPQCIIYPLENDPTKPLSVQDATNQYNNDLSQKQYMVSKLNQSILRVQNEQRLRAKGLDRRQDIVNTQPSTPQEKSAIQTFKAQIQAEAQVGNK